MRFFSQASTSKALSKAVGLALFSDSKCEFKVITFSHVLARGEGKRGRRHIYVPLSGMVQKFILPVDQNPWPHQAAKEPRKSGVR